MLKEIIYKTDPSTMDNFLELSLANTKLFQWKFLHVARRFGVISRDAELGKISMSKIIDVYKHTPVWEETMNEIKVEKLDVENSKKIIEAIQKREIEVVFLDKLTPLGKAGLRMKSEVVSPERPELQVLDIFKKRLLTKKVKLVCLNCGKWSMIIQVKDLPEEIRCHNCRAKLVAVCSPKLLEAEKIVRKSIQQKEMSDAEKARLEKMKKISDLVIVYGKRAVIALSARGVGPKVASRILRNLYLNEDDFYKAILEAERTFVRTKKFWK
jgi:ATP-dependent Lhr-like helicase